MHFRPDPEADLLTVEERRLAERLLEAPALAAEHAELERLLKSGRKGAFEQERLGPPSLPSWPFYDRG